MCLNSPDCPCIHSEPSRSEDFQIVGQLNKKKTCGGGWVAQITNRYAQSVLAAEIQVSGFSRLSYKRAEPFCGMKSLAELYILHTRV